MKLKTIFMICLGLGTAQLYTCDSQDMAKILLFNDVDAAPRQDSVEYYMIQEVATVLEEQLTQDERDALCAEFDEEYYAKWMEVWFQYTGGPYRFSLGLLNFLGEQFGQLRDSNEGMKVQQWLQESVQVEKSVDYHQEIFDWFIDYDVVMHCVCKRQFDCLFVKRDQAMALWGYDEKSLTAAKVYYEIALRQFIFIQKFGLEFREMALQSFKDQIKDTGITSYDVVKMQRFLHSDLGKKFKTVHETCMRIATGVIAQNINF